MKLCRIEGCVSTDLASRSAMCTEHHRDYVRAHYKANKSKYLDKAQKHRDGNTLIIREAKNVPCLDCGIKYPYYVMDFDHRENKEFNLAHRGQYGRLQIIAEIAKCDVVCANCHRVRTALRGGYHLEENDGMIKP